MTEFDVLQLVALLMVAALVFPSLWYYMKRGKKGEGLRNIAIWLMVALGVALLFKFFGPIN